MANQWVGHVVKFAKDIARSHPVEASALRASVRFGIGGRLQTGDDLLYFLRRYDDEPGLGAKVARLTSKLIQEHGIERRSYPWRPSWYGGGMPGRDGEPLSRIERALAFECAAEYVGQVCGFGIVDDEALAKLYRTEADALRTIWERDALKICTTDKTTDRESLEIMAEHTRVRGIEDEEEFCEQLTDRLQWTEEQIEAAVVAVKKGAS